MGEDDPHHGDLGFGMIGFFRTLHERAQTPEAAQLHHEAIRFGEWLVRLPSEVPCTVALFVALIGAAGEL